MLTDYGEELIMRDFYAEDVAKPSSIDVGLYNQSTDSLADDSDVSDITTEPSGSAYSRQTIDFGSSAMTVEQNDDNDYQVTFDKQTFDVSDSTQEVDYYFVVASFESDIAGDTSAEDHLIGFGALAETVDLSSFNNFELEPSGMSLD